MILADTGAIVALIDATDQHHATLRQLFESDPAAWALPWVILPEVDYLVGKYSGPEAQADFLADLVGGGFWVEWGGESRDLARAEELTERYRDLKLGLVDAVVMAMAERLKARAIATLDLRHFGAVVLSRPIQLFPRDLPSPQAVPAPAGRRSSR
jgi:uncharacterized protein